jgi:translocation and assembly module TamA
MRFGVAKGRGLGRAIALALLAGAAVPVAVLPATAFELFGIRLWGSSDEDTDTDIVDPLRYSATLTVTDGDEDLQDTLEDASELMAGQERPVSGSLGLLSRARADRELLIAALFRTARYDGIVNIAIGGRALEDIPPDVVFTGEPVPVTITVDPGAVFTLGDVALKGDAANLVPARFGLIAGGPAGSGDILKAEADIVRVLREEGRPLAKVTGREIVADHATRTLDVSLNVAAGPIAPFGETTVEGTEQVDREFTRYMTGLEPGRIYSPKEMKEARDRLAGLEVFSSINLREAEALNPDGSIPIYLRVSERKFRYYGAGASYSTTDGLGLEGYWGHRNLFGRAEKLRIGGSISGIGDRGDLGELNYNAGIMFEKPGVIGPDSKFFANLRTVYEHPDAYDRFSTRAGVGVQYELSPTQTLSAELAVDWEKVTDALNPEGKDYLLVSTPLQYVFDNRDDKLNPKRGFRALAFAEPTYDFLNSTSFVKLRAEGSAYRAVDDAGRFVLAGRAVLGSIMGAELADIPADRRFYSGGGGSVRGYAYQGIGPKDAFGQPIGGRSLAEASLEMRIGVTDTIGVVPFIDAGTVSEAEFPDFSDFKAGAGLGLRYITPFGPLRVDVAVPLNPDQDDPSFGLYAGIGQAF